MTSPRRKRISILRLASLGYLVLLLLSVCAPSVVAPYSPLEQQLDRVWQPPSIEHPFGTDGLGRDVLSRLVFGARVSVLVALFAVTSAIAIGVPTGLLAGYHGGALDFVIMRVVDILYAFPTLILVIFLAAILKAGLGTPEGPLAGLVSGIEGRLGGIVGIAIAMAIGTWPVVCRLVRGGTLVVREAEFVLAAHSLGASATRVLLRHVLPNLIGSVLTAASLIIPHAIMLEAGLSFLGLGIDPPMPSWGGMIREGALAMRAHPHMLISAALSVVFTIVTASALADYLQESAYPGRRYARGFSRRS